MTSVRLQMQEVQGDTDTTSHLTLCCLDSKLEKYVVMQRQFGLISVENKSVAHNRSVIR